EISESEDLEVSFVPMADVKEHQIYFNPRETRQIKEVYTGYTYFKENDVLLAKVTPCFENGKSGIAKNLKNKMGFGSSEFHVLRASDKVLPQFVYYIISSKRFINSGKKQMSGTGGLKRLSKDYVASFKITLPPLTIQKKIVAILEKVEKLKQKREEADKKTAEYVEGEFHKIFEKNNFEKLKLGSVCELNPKKSEIREPEDLEVSFVPMADVKEHQIYFNLNETRKIKEVYTGYTYFKENDVLLAKVTPCFENGKSGIAKNLKNKMGFGSSEFHVLRASDKILPQIIYYVISSERFINSGKKQMSGTGGLKRLSKDYVTSFQIPLPPLPLQQKFAKIVEKVEKLKDKQKESKQKINELFDVLMQRAFKGELVA
ncbi:MAG: restriction endonuclease subunit S, partial [Nanoarchaeota archaeon]|nr:restriction endonuclease subunit S [Nanoarchaeota archaeon]